jgi:hypothetical protein
MTTTPMLRDIHLAELINDLMRASHTLTGVVDGEPSDRHAIVEAFLAIDAAAEFLTDLREGGDR